MYAKGGRWPLIRTKYFVKVDSQVCSPFFGIILFQVLFHELSAIYKTYVILVRL